jgi:hypothetical protein
MEVMAADIGGMIHVHLASVVMSIGFVCRTIKKNSA